jgi:hypothetical protein
VTISTGAIATAYNMDKDKKELEEKLQNSFFVVGGGAWQQLWEMDDDRPSMGFNPDLAQARSEAPSSKDLKTSIRPELLKRFRAEVLVMQPMSVEDYRLLIPQFADYLPVTRQALFIRLAEKGLAMAVKEQLGMRYFEEVLTQTICSKLNANIEK